MAELSPIEGVSGIEALQGLYGVMPQAAPKSRELGGDEVPAEEQSFRSIFDAAMGLVEQTNTLQNKASNEAIKFELGYTDNTHDLMIASQEANIALQYTKAVRDRFLESYNALMQMQI